MMLGKRPRPRPPIKRTTSLSEITFDLNTAMDEDPFNNRPGPVGPCPRSNGPPGGFNGSDQSRILASVSPRNSSDLTLTHTPDFLRVCFLCKRRLVSDRDIYMYRGDSAFCILECRQQQMNQDEKKDKRCVASKKRVVAPPQVTTTKS